MDRDHGLLGLAASSSGFSGLGLKSWLQQQCRSIGLSEPTPVQKNCIPAILAGKDCVGCAKTGSGKTLAFALPMLHRLSDDPFGIFGLVLTPTRELALQIADQFRIVGRPLNLKDCVIVGGRDMVMQGRELAARPHIVIATPGRLADHLESCNTFSLKGIKFLVFDEADRLLDGGFDHQLSVIFKALPPRKSRQTLFFSATLTDTMQELQDFAATSEGGSPGHVWEAGDLGETKTVAELDQRYVLTPANAKDAYLVHLLQKLVPVEGRNFLVIVFTKTCRNCQLLSMTLNTLGFPNAALHSMIPQRERMAGLAKFRSCQVKILVATDLASRGLDIPQVQLVLNHNVPEVAKDYIHRVGRTARAGRGGMAVTLVTRRDVELVQAVEAEVGRKMDEFKVDDDAVVEIHAQVGVTKREQDIRLSEMDFDEKRNINERKRLLMEGRDPDEEAIKSSSRVKSKVPKHKT